MDFFQKLADYLKLTKLEVKNVNWPTRRETVRFTLLVIAVSAGVAAYLGLLDFIFINLLERFVL
ncbi:MAG: preprotein translocase subunit SecE [Candidatus Niyogibacteria bacterium RIFCSPLOWO2_02_FULL_45_13]|uniref:Protein translocase subunit SecE n=1 Tax=Candidatus Niyogibacteria bacterium RIFCSPLOWO2_02_FULL_45_13 TaxID=1801725 RepID=A0A1G2EYV2_9BACT|nr:MAG: preprotein translocase subunit SecE [Candidatus Niyogibacteria bacterium RIFCSPLOWO2_02_FULL_45_13]